MCADVAGVCRATWDGEGASRVLTDYESASLNAIAMDFNQPRIICLGEGFQIEGIFKSHFHRKPKSAHMHSHFTGPRLQCGSRWCLTRESLTRISELFSNTNNFLFLSRNQIALWKKIALNFNFSKSSQGIPVWVCFFASHSSNEFSAWSINKHDQRWSSIFCYFCANTSRFSRKINVWFANKSSRSIVICKRIHSPYRLAGEVASK